MSGNKLLDLSFEFAVEGGVHLVRCGILACVLGLVVCKSVNDTSLEQVLGNDLGNILYSHSRIEGALGIYDHDRTQRAQAEAARLDYLDLVLKAVCLELF